MSFKSWKAQNGVASKTESTEKETRVEAPVSFRQWREQHPTASAEPEAPEAPAAPQPSTERSTPAQTGRLRPGWDAADVATAYQQAIRDTDSVIRAPSGLSEVNRTRQSPSAAAQTATDLESRMEQYSATMDNTQRNMGAMTPALQQARAGVDQRQREFDGYAQKLTMLQDTFSDDKLDAKQRNDAIREYNALLPYARQAAARLDSEVNTYNSLAGQAQQMEAQYNEALLNYQQALPEYDRISSRGNLDAKAFRSEGDKWSKVASDAGAAADDMEWRLMYFNPNTTTPEQIGAYQQQMFDLRTREQEANAKASEYRRQEEAAQKRYQNYQYNQMMAGVEKYMTDPNWDKLSRVDRSMLGGKVQYRNGTVDYGQKDVDYSIINGDSGVLSAWNGNNSIAMNKSYLTQMTDRERAGYNYLYAAKGKDAADAFLKELEPTLNARQRGANRKMWTEMAQQDPWGTSAFSVLATPAKMISLFGQAIDLVTDGNIDQNAAYNSYSHIPSDIRGAVSEQIEKKWGKAGSFAYQTGMSMADFLFQSAITGEFFGASAGATGLAKLTKPALLIMGSGAAADTVIELRDRGVDSTRAMALGTIAGLAEIITENVSLENLLNPDKLADGVIRYILKNMAAEGSEELGSDVINWAADALYDLISGQEEAEWKYQIRQLQKEGMGVREATQKVTLDMIKQAGLDALGGMISGGVMAGGGAPIQLALNSNVGQAARAAAQATRQDLAERNAPAPVEAPAQIAGPAPVEAVAEAQTVSPLQAAVDKLTAGEPLTQNDGRRILRDETAMQTLRDAGVLTETVRDDAAGRQTVRQAVEQYVAQQAENRAQEEQQADVTPVEETPRTEGLRLPTAEETLTPPTPRGTLTLGNNANTEVTNNGQQTEAPAPAPAEQRTAPAPEAGTVRNASVPAGRQSTRGDTGRGSGLGRFLVNSFRENYRGARAQQQQNRRANALSAQAAARGDLTWFSGSEITPEGSDEKIGAYAPEELWDDELKQTVQEYADKGVTLTPILDQIGMKGGPSARAYVSADGKQMWVQINHDRLSWQQLVAHEELHRELKVDPGLRAEIIRDLKSDPEIAKNYDKILRRYVEMYNDMGVTDAAKIEEEMLADYRAGFDMLKDTIGSGAMRAKMQESIRATEARYETNGGKTAPEGITESFAEAKSSVEPPYRLGTKAADAFADGLNEQARGVYDMFLDVHEASLANTAVMDVGSGKNTHAKRVPIADRFLTADEWNAQVKSNPEFAQAAKNIFAVIPENIRKNARLNSDGTIAETGFEKHFKMARSLMQRLVDALPKGVVSSTVELDGKQVKVARGRVTASVGGEEYRRAMIAEKRKLYAEGKLPTRSLESLSHDNWGAMGFLATNTKTIASGDFTTFCPQMYFNDGCWYCYRRSALTTGINNKLTAETVWYTGEILQLRQEDIDKLNEVGGLRIQSFGDWQSQYSTMLADLLIDAEKVGLQIKVITKEPSMIDTVALLKEQGIGKNLYFNLSADYTIERRGEVDNTNTEDALPMNPERPFLKKENAAGEEETWWKRALTVQEANEYRKQYPWVNTRIVATNADEFIRGLQDPTVDVVTGYHGTIRQYERVSSETGEVLMDVEPLGDAGMPRFAYNRKTGEWTMEYEGKTKYQKQLAQRIQAEGLEREYYTKSCCIFGRCAKCQGKCGSYARSFAAKNATNRDLDSVKYWQREMESGVDNPLLLSQQDGMASLDPTFEAKYQQWINNGRPNGTFIDVGTTPEMLTNAGIEPRRYSWDTSKLNATQKKHSYMTDDLIRQASRMINQPVLVLESDSRANSIVFYGEVYAPDKDGLPVPVMAAVQLTPTRGGYVIDEYKVASAYARERPEDIPSREATQRLLDKSSYLYIDPNKERTQNWLQLTRLQLPFVPDQYGFIDKVTLSPKDVKGNLTFDARGAETQDWKKKLAEAMPDFDSGDTSIETRPSEGRLLQQHMPSTERSSSGRGRSTNGGKRKVSRVRTHAFELGGLYNEVEAQMAETQPEEFTYDPISEKRSMNEALGRLKKDFAGEAEKLAASDQWGGSDLDTAMGILYQYRQIGRETGDYSLFNEWSHVIQQKGTKGGQFVQAFAKYSRTATGVAQKAAENLRETAGKLNPKQQKLIEGHVSDILGAIDNDTEAAARDAVEKSKGKKGLRLPGGNDTQRARDAENIIKQIHKIFSQQTRRSHGLPVEEWTKATGDQLADRIASRLKEPGTKTQTTMQTILGDLVTFAQEHALPTQEARQHRTALDRITDYLNNREAYAEAWGEAKQVLRDMYADDAEKLEALESFLNATITYNGDDFDRTMFRAILEASDLLGMDKQDILDLAAVGTTESVINRIADEFVRRVGVDDATLRDTVRRHIENIVRESNVDGRLERMESEASKELDIKIQDLLRESRRTKADAANRIAQYLINDLGISGTDAAIAADHIAGHYMDQLQQRADRVVERMFAEKKAITKKQRDKLLDLIHLGGLTNANVEDAVVDALGLNKVSRAQQRQIMDAMAQFADTLDAIEDNDLEGLRQLIREQAAVRNTKLSSMAEDVLNHETDVEYLRNFATAQLGLIAADYEARSLGEKVSTVQVISHLLNARTAMRNVTSNQIFDLVDSTANNVGLLSDLIMSQITGQRTVGFEKSWASKAKRQGAVKGMGRSILEVALDVAPSDRNKSKYGTGGRRTFSMANSGVVGRILSRAEKIMGYELNTTDEFHKGSVYAETLESLGRFVDAGYMTEEEAAEFAAQEALYRSFQDDTKMGAFLSGLKDVLNVIAGTGKTNGKTIHGLPVHDFGLGDLVVKYTQVPGALIHRAIEFSPAGYAKAIYNIAQLGNAKSRGESTIKQQRNAALALGRATTGSGLITLFTLLAKLGLLRRGDDEKNKDAAALKTSQGLSGTQINLTAISRLLSGESAEPQQGDVLHDIGFLEPLDSLMTIAALINNDPEIKNLNLYEMFRSAETAKKFVGKSLQGIWLALEDTSAMQTLSNIYSTIRYHDEENDLPLYMQIPMEIASSAVSGFIPAPIRQLAQATDTTYRDQYRSRDLLAQTGARVANAIPGLRLQLAPKLTPLGKDKTYQEPWLNALNALVNPGNINIYDTDEVRDELLKVYEETGDGSMLPARNAPYSINIGHESYTLTPDERTEYLRIRGQEETKFVESLLATSWYRNADADTKAAFLNSAKNIANDIAKSQWAAERGITYRDTTYRKYLKMLADGTRYADVIKANNEDLVDTVVLGVPRQVWDDTKEAFNDIANSDISSYDKGVQQRALICDLELNDRQKLVVYGDLANTESREEQFRTVMDTGLSFNETAKIFDKYSEYKSEDETRASQDAKDFALWVDQRQDLTDEQKKVIKEQFKYWQMIPAEAERYEKYTGLGFEPEVANRIDSALSELQPLPDHDGVTNMQRAKAALEALGKNASQADRMKVVESFYGGDLRNKNGELTQWGKINKVVNSGKSIEETMKMVEDETLDRYVKWMDSEAKTAGVNFSTYQTLYDNGTLDEYMHWNSSDVKKAGISSDVYITFALKYNDTKSERDETTGKEIKGQTKQDKIIAYIDSLKLTADQKDALYLDKYTAAKLKDTPWHKGGSSGRGKAYAMSGLRLPTPERREPISNGLKLQSTPAAKPNSGGLKLR